MSGTGPKAGGLHSLHGYSQNLSYEGTNDLPLELYEVTIKVDELVASKIKI